MNEEPNRAANQLFRDFQFDYHEIISWLKENNFKSVAVQLPEGLKRKAVELIKTLETDHGITAILLADPCFGACDVGGAKLEGLGVDAVIHIGHSELPNCTKPKVPIKYVELQSTIDIGKLISEPKNLEFLKTEFTPPCNLGILTNVQFITQLENVITLLEAQGYQVLLGAGDDRIKHPGQVLGCNFSAARAINDQVEGFWFIGDGMFHPLGVALVTKKKVLAFSPENNGFQDIAELREKILRQRSGAIGALKDCINFGILVSTKSGQNRLEYAKKIQNKLNRSNRSGALLVFDTITPPQLDYLPFDGYINTACPRLAIDDYVHYKKPIITPMELEIILGERSWENYAFDEIK